MLRTVRYECDRAMARKRGLAGKCDEDCPVCFCGFEIDEDGQKQHCDVARNKKDRLLLYKGDLITDEDTSD